MEQNGEPGLVAEIQAMIDRETQAWNEQDAQTLTDLFHPDMVWPWPADNRSHNPLQWTFGQGRFNRERWIKNWQTLFEQYGLVHNKRKTLKISISAEGDGAFAVVDVDTLWKHKNNGSLFHWKGLAGKGYTKLDKGWKLIFHTGLLEYTK